MSTLIAPRRKTHTVDIAGVKVGGGHPIVVQSMTNTDTADATGTATQQATGTASATPTLRGGVASTGGSGGGTGSGRSGCRGRTGAVTCGITGGRTGVPQAFEAPDHRGGLGANTGAVDATSLRCALQDRRQDLEQESLWPGHLDTRRRKFEGG